MQLKWLELEHRVMLHYGLVFIIITSDVPFPMLPGGSRCCPHSRRAAAAALNRLNSTRVMMVQISAMHAGGLGGGYGTYVPPNGNHSQQQIELMGAEHRVQFPLMSERVTDGMERREMARRK